MVETRLIDKYGMEPAERERRKGFLGLLPKDARAIAVLRDAFAGFAEQFAEAFYAHLLSHPPLAGFFEDPQLVERLKQAQQAYFEELLTGEYDEEYFESRLRVGETHERVGVQPGWYLSAYSQYVQICLPYFAEATGGRVGDEVMSLLKVIFLDLTLTLETYFAKSTEEIRRRNAELEEALRLYWLAQRRALQYAKLAGHEIRGSLNAIVAASDVLLEEYGEQMDPEARQMVEGIQNRCWRIVGVTEEILEQPEERGEVGWVEMSEVFSELQTRIDLYRDEKAVTLTLPDHAPRVWGDPIGLREVFANLVSNAVRHMDKSRGRIRVEYDGEGDAEGHRFVVSDNGPGIPRELQERIFEPFYQAPGSAAKAGKGLGLHLVRTIVEQHGGRVWVESAPGEGSRFCVCLPSQAPAEYQAGEPKSP